MVIEAAGKEGQPAHLQHAPRERGGLRCRGLCGRHCLRECRRLGERRLPHGERTIALDCDVLQADGGTRTAAITGAFVAAQDAVNRLLARGKISRSPIVALVAAISVGIVQGTPLLDLEYTEDSACDTDMNVVMTGAGHFVEVQGTAEGAAFSRAEMDALLNLAEKGIVELMALQQQALAQSLPAA